LPEKHACDEFPPYKFSVADGTLYFPLSSCHRLENFVLEIWFLITRAGQ